jgi:hypothetical protein
MSGEVFETTKGKTMTTTYPPQTVQSAFRLFADSVGAMLSSISDAGSAYGRQYSLNWDDRLHRWFVLAYECDVGSWPILSIIGVDAQRPN